MKWLVVVIFATMQGDVYIFTDPVFDDRESCVASIYDSEQMKRYVQKLVIEYQRLLPIKALNCLDEQTINDILNIQDNA